MSNIGKFLMTDNDHVLPIGAVSRMIGISSHTLRKWESRYALVSTQRTPSGRRLYTQGDIEKLILVRDLIALGHQVNRLAALSNAELEELLSRSNADIDSQDVESVLHWQQPQVEGHRSSMGPRTLDQPHPKSQTYRHVLLFH